MRSDGSADAALKLSAACLLIVAYVLWNAGQRVRALEETAQLELNRRRVLQERVQTREEQLDGALAKIRELMPDEPAAAGE